MKFDNKLDDKTLTEIIKAASPLVFILPITGDYLVHHMASRYRDNVREKDANRKARISLSYLHEGAIYVLKYATYASVTYLVFTIANVMSKAQFSPIPLLP